MRNKTSPIGIKYDSKLNKKIFILLSLFSNGLFIDAKDLKLKSCLFEKDVYYFLFFITLGDIAGTEVDAPVVFEFNKNEFYISHTIEYTTGTATDYKKRALTILYDKMDKKVYRR